MSTFTRRLGDDYTIAQHQSSDADNEVQTIREVGHNYSNCDTSNNIGTFSVNETGFAFESILEQSWVYRRNERNECDCSFVSSVQRSHAWSVFSGYSLADISILSVIAMPLTLRELANARYYRAQAEVSGFADDQPIQLISDSTTESSDVSDASQAELTAAPEDGHVRELLEVISRNETTETEDTQIDVSDSTAGEIDVDNDEDDDSYSDLIPPGEKLMKYNMRQWPDSLMQTTLITILYMHSTRLKRLSRGRSMRPREILWCCSMTIIITGG